MLEAIFKACQGLATPVQTPTSFQLDTLDLCVDEGSILLIETTFFWKETSEATESAAAAPNPQETNCDELPEASSQLE